ncbi:MAG: hypothetical protein ABIO60_03450 [Aquaticitalea sp.]
MKILFCLFAIMMFNNKCGQNKSEVPNTAALNSEISMATQDNIMIGYEASTRGFYERIWVAKDSVTYTNDRNQVEKTTHPISETDWSELMALLKDIDINTLPELDSPTSLRHHDGAPFATFFITKEKVETKSNSFDHGHPPKDIEAIVNKIVSMMEKFKKD